jgi:hypothetical protein
VGAFSLIWTGQVAMLPGTEIAKFAFILRTGRECAMEAVTIDKFRPLTPGSRRSRPDRPDRRPS